MASSSTNPGTGNKSVSTAQDKISEIQDMEATIQSQFQRVSSNLGNGEQVIGEKLTRDGIIGILKSMKSRLGVYEVAIKGLREIAPALKSKNLPGREEDMKGFVDGKTQEFEELKCKVEDLVQKVQKKFSRYELHEVEIEIAEVSEASTKLGQIGVKFFSEEAYIALLLKGDLSFDDAIYFAKKEFEKTDELFKGLERVLDARRKNLKAERQKLGGLPAEPPLAERMQRSRLAQQEAEKTSGKGKGKQRKP